MCGHGITWERTGCRLPQVEVEASPIFERHGYDVVVPRTIDFLDAILGGTIRCACHAHARARNSDTAFLGDGCCFTP